MQNSSSRCRRKSRERALLQERPGTSGRASGRAGERDRRRRGIKARETGQTSCYILEEHSNSDMKREAHSVNEDPRGNASGTRRRERRGTVYTHAPATRTKGRKKGVSGMEKGPSRERRGGNRGARVVPREHSRPSETPFAHLALLLSSVSR